MKAYLYLSLIPEALVASHLAPEQYGAYLATGARHRSRGQAIFFKLSDQFASARLDALGVDSALDRPMPQSPRHSFYLSVYRVLEQTPLEALESLHLVTSDGRVLTLQPADYESEKQPQFHLYQEFCPATPQIVSRLEPKVLGAQITDLSQHVSLPAVVFAELRLDQLANDPNSSAVGDLPYSNLEHLRDCLRELDEKPKKATKTVVRFLQQDVLFRTLHRGFYVAASQGKFRFFPIPSRERLEIVHHAWWRSAVSSIG